MQPDDSCTWLRDLATTRTLLEAPSHRRALVDCNADIPKRIKPGQSGSGICGAHLLEFELGTVLKILKVASAARPEVRAGRWRVRTQPNLETSGSWIVIRSRIRWFYNEQRQRRRRCVKNKYPQRPPPPKKKQQNQINNGFSIGFLSVSDDCACVTLDSAKPQSLDS